MFMTGYTKFKIIYPVVILVLLLSITMPPPLFTQAREESFLHQPWGYEGGTGPEHWGEMEQDHEKHLMCREGVHQSPVDLRNVQGLHLSRLNIDYSVSPIQITNNTHTIQVKYQPGSFIVLGDEIFELIQFHFHHPSEHLVNGKKFPMEIHLVHKTQDNEYVIIAVLVEAGKFNPWVQTIWDRIPTKIDKEIVYEHQMISANNLLPQSREYSHYIGSLTTPPCTENVTWLVLEEPVEFSESQLKYFKKFIDHNARPVQKLHHRIIVKLR